jgi:hypothetical protein
MILKYVLLVSLTVASAFGDSRGFIWSYQAWAKPSVDWRYIGLALLGYGFGIATWLFAVKYLRQVGGLGVSSQATAWFLLTIIGVAVATGEFVRWPLLDKSLAILCIGSFAVLVYRTSS